MKRAPEGVEIPRYAKIGKGNLSTSDYPRTRDPKKIDTAKILPADQVVSPGLDPLGEVLRKEKTGELWEKKEKEDK